jgi:hypothetical protein
MPLNPPTLAAGFVAPQLVAMGNVGTGVSNLALGVSIGVCQFLTIASKVMTVDVGTAGVGTSIIPMIVPTPLLQTSLVISFTSSGLIGTMAPLFLQGLATGICTGLTALALLQTNHPTVGVGTGIARIVAPTAVPVMIQGFAAAGMSSSGPVRIATALGAALDMTFAAYVQPGIPIVGSPSIVPSAGIGLGVVL